MPFRTKVDDNGLSIASNVPNEFALVLYYYGAPLSKLKVEEVDGTPICIQIRWAYEEQRPGDKGRYTDSFHSNRSSAYFK